jgi:enoyl-[acyl-carrier protein] reductase I
MDFLQLREKRILVLGVANKKSVAYQTACLLQEAGAELVYSVRSEQRRAQLREKLLAGAEIHVCDVEHEPQIRALADEVGHSGQPLHGILHSIAFADYEGAPQPFHQTSKAQLLRAMDISCYSLIAIANAFRPQLAHDASVVTVSISTTRMAAENYGFMAPIKAALDSSLAFLTKSFSGFSQVRFNAVGPSLLKTSASAGIPGYLDSYLFAEQVIPRRAAVQTVEAAHVAAFLLSPRSSGIVAQTVVVDAGMSINYFDRNIIAGVVHRSGGESRGSTTPFADSGRPTSAPTTTLPPPPGQSGTDGPAS